LGENGLITPPEKRIQKLLKELYATLIQNSISKFRKVRDVLPIFGSPALHMKTAKADLELSGAARQN